MADQIFCGLCHQDVSRLAAPSHAKAGADA
jgi:hypothetical protein